jgi:hypothetical protein
MTPEFYTNGFDKVSPFFTFVAMVLVMCFLFFSPLIVVFVVIWVLTTSIPAALIMAIAAQVMYLWFFW